MEGGAPVYVKNKLRAPEERRMRPLRGGPSLASSQKELQHRHQRLAHGWRNYPATRLGGKQSFQSLPPPRPCRVGRKQRIRLCFFRTNLEPLEPCWHILRTCHGHALSVGEREA